MPTCRKSLTQMRPSARMEGADSSRNDRWNGRWDGTVSWPGDGPTAWSRSSPPGWTESTGKSASIWRKRSQAMAVLTRPWGASKRETRRCVVTAISRWIPQSTHSSSAQNGVWQGSPSVRQWVPSLLLTRWSFSCSSLSGSGRSSSHSPHFWWRRESSKGVESETTGRASRNCIGACTRGPTSRADSTVRVVRGRILISLPLPGAACLVRLERVRPRMKVPGEWMTEESCATSSWNQPPTKLNKFCEVIGIYPSLLQEFYPWSIEKSLTKKSCVLFSSGLKASVAWVT